MASSTAYATAAEVKSEIGKTTNNWDTVLTNIVIPAASRAIDNYCNRKKDGFVSASVATARLYTGQGKPYLFIDECTSITLVEVKDSATDSTYQTWTSSDWIAFTGDAIDPDFNTLPYTAVMVDPTGDYDIFPSGYFSTRRGFKPEIETKRGIPTVRITAKWGYAVTVPSEIKQACIIQSARWFKRGESSWADTLASTEMGNLVFQLRQPLDPDVRMILDSGRFVNVGIG
jgi:hypothetical protein